MITPIRGLETANQNGITSLNGMASRATIAVSKIVFIPFSLMFDSVAAIARVLDFRVPWLDYSGSLGSQRLHFCAAWNLRWLSVWNDNLWSVEPPCSLLKQMSSGVKFDLIKDEDLSRDKPDCETDHQGA